VIREIEALLDEGVEIGGAVFAGALA